jgi:hypothetical protein
VFSFLCLCPEDFSTLVIVLAYNEQTCMFFVHVFQNALSFDEGTVANYTPEKLFRAFKLVRAAALSTG